MPLQARLTPEMAVACATLLVGDEGRVRYRLYARIHALTVERYVRVGAPDLWPATGSDHLTLGYVTVEAQRAVLNARAVTFGLRAAQL